MQQYKNQNNEIWVLVTGCCNETETKLAVEREERLENENKAKQEVTEASEATKTGAASAASTPQSRYNRDPMSDIDFQFLAQ